VCQVVLQQRMLEQWEGQLQAAQLQWQQQEAAARSAWQQQLMQQVQEALGPEVAEGLRLRVLPLLQRSSGDGDEDAVEGQRLHEQQLQAEGLQLPAAAADAMDGCLADADSGLNEAVLGTTAESGVEREVTAGISG
jgi:hypothetical protein